MSRFVKHPMLMKVPS